MTRSQYRPIIVLAIIGCLAFSGTATAAKKVKAYNAQTTYTFENAGETQAYGLHVVLSSEAIVVTDEATGAAGLFKDVKGNGTAAIVMTNPESPITAVSGDNTSVELVFRSYKSKLSVKTWWWVDQKGKRIGKKQKG